jgi:hypothetical protein
MGAKSGIHAPCSPESLVRLTVTHKPISPAVYARSLQLLGRGTFPNAVAKTLNHQAKITHHEVVKGVKKRFTVRTRYTIQSIRNDRKAKGNNINAMYSRVVSLSPYLGVHDEGGTRDAKGSGKLPIPMKPARGGNNSNMILTRMRMDKIGELKKNKRFFVGVPKGRTGGSSSGIWERVGKKNIRRVRHLTVKQARIKRTNFFTAPFKKYSSKQYQNAVFSKIAEKEINRRIG